MVNIGFPMILKMVNKEILLTLDATVLEKLDKRSKKLGYSSTQKYIYELIRRSLHSKSSRKPRVDFSKIDPLIPKFAEPTKETYKILRDVKPI
jgi:hypothetical protein